MANDEKAYVWQPGEPMQQRPNPSPGMVANDEARAAREDGLPDTEFNRKYIGDWPASGEPIPPSKSVEARAAAREFLGKAGFGDVTFGCADTCTCERCERALADLLTRYAAKAVVGEAEWWADGKGHLGNKDRFGNSNLTIMEKERIAALKEQAK